MCHDDREADEQKMSTRGGRDEGVPVEPVDSELETNRRDARREATEARAEDRTHFRVQAMELRGG